MKINGIEKLSEYCLNEEHPRGKYKARIFKSVLGFEKKDSEILKILIKESIKTFDAHETFRDIYGIRYNVDILYKAVVIRTSWIIKTNETLPRFISCYIKSKRI